MRERLRIAIRGAVQGVGFRPFVYRLARSLNLDGWVLNSPQGVFIEVEGARPILREFLRRTRDDAPPRAVIQSLESSWLDPIALAGFVIRESAHDGAQTAFVLPDLAICDDCRREILTPSDRRYRYPFTNCTNCGPRFSIIEALPYDRVATSMRRFEMCPACRAEYHDPANRRFHAQPNACPVCGPAIALWDGTGRALAAADDALQRTAHAIRQGRIVAVKGLGGFHLVTDATNDDAVRQLRARKHREEKPFALMYPDLDSVRRNCVVSDAEAQLLTSPESPIVLLERLGDETSAVAASVAPGSRTLGVMLPYTPLHLLLVGDVRGPIVATSGNRSDEPICIDEHEALERLTGIADLFLVHNRPIVRHVDDSIVRVVLDRELVLRRARGYAPLPVPVRSVATPALAVGAHLKNTVALAADSSVFISQHLGDLETPQAVAAFSRAIDDMQVLFQTRPAAIVADMHPDYVSTSRAARLGSPVVHVQHHVAHVAGCLAENDLLPPALGVSWDGTGLGADSTIWGGEFLHLETGGWSRIACLRPFRLPGGDAAIREPRRAALGVLHALYGSAGLDFDLAVTRTFRPEERRLLGRMLDAGLHAPITTSAGRLFDAVAALLSLRTRSSFEGQAAMALEWTAAARVEEFYPFTIESGDSRPRLGMWQPPALVIDWAATIDAIHDDLAADVSTGDIAAKFHNTLAEMIAATAERVGEPRVVLSGGCFQNRRLTERTVAALHGRGFAPYWHQRVPPNDGGLSYGQIAAWAFGWDRPSAGADLREPSRELSHVSCGTRTHR